MWEKSLGIVTGMVGCGMNNRITVKDTGIDGLKIISPCYTEDSRGYFVKSLERDVLKQHGLQLDVQEEFESYSRRDVIRGLHFQSKNPQVKIIRVIKGAVYDVAVDLRKGSPSFGRHIGMELTDNNHLSLWIPSGFAHGFRVLSEDAIMSYCCIGKYEMTYDTGIRWDDPHLAIRWNCNRPIISEKDYHLQSFQEFVESCGGLQSKVF